MGVPKKQGFPKPSLSSPTITTTVNDLISSSSVWQLPLALLLIHYWTLVCSIYGFGFLVPKAQSYDCSPMYNMTDEQWRLWNERVDLSCSYSSWPDSNVSSSLNSSRIENCQAWTYDTAHFTWTMKQEFNLVCENEWKQALCECAFMAGLIIGNFVFSHVSDWYGRKRSIVLSTVLLSVGAFMMPLAPTFVTFNVFRVVMAIGWAGGYNGIVTLALETMSERHRAAFSFCDVLGGIIYIFVLPILPYLIRNWRWLSFAYALGSVPTIIVAIVSDESIKWLLAQGQVERARPIVRRMLRRQGMADGDRDVDETIRNSSPRNNVTKCCDQKSDRPSAISLFSHRSTTIISLSFLIQFSLNPIIYFNMMSFIMNVGSNMYTNTLFAGMPEIPGLVLVFAIVKLVRRKMFYPVLYIPSAIAMSTLFFTSEGDTFFRMIAAGIAKMNAQVLWSIMSVHVNESYPTKTRGIALGVFFMAARFGSLAAYILKSLISMPVLTGLNIGSCLFGLLVSLPLQETFNRPLPDDDDDVKDNGDTASAAYVMDDTISKNPPTEDGDPVNKIGIYVIETCKL